MPVDGAKESMNADINAQLQTMNVEQGLRLKLSAIVDINCVMMGGSALRALSGMRGAEEIEMKTKTFSTFTQTLMGTEHIRIREDVSAANVSLVLSANGDCMVRGILRAGERAVVDGTLTINALVGAGDGRLSQLTQHIPFSLDAPIDWAGSDGECFAEIEMEYVELRPIGESSGLLSAEAGLIVSVYCRKEIEYALPLDAYVPLLPLRSVSERIQLMIGGENNVFKHNANENVSVPEGMPEVFRVVYCTARPIVTASKAVNARMSVEGLMFTRVIYQTEGGSLYSFTEDIPFIAETLCNAKYTDVQAGVRCLSCSGSGNGKTLELSYMLAIDAKPYATEEVSVVTGMEESEPIVPPKGLIVYYAGEGETLFDIGKRFNLTRNALLKANPGASETLHEGEKLMMLI